MGVSVPTERGDLGVEPPADTCTCLIMMHQGTAPISDFASDEIIFDLLLFYYLLGPTGADMVSL